MLCQALEPAELLVAVAEGAFEASSNGHLASLAIRLSIELLLPAAGGACDAGQQALLHLELPANYPATEAARVEALTCALLGRAAEARCAAALQAVATEAAAAPCGGQECLYPLAEAAAQQLRDALEDRQQQAQGAARAGGAQPGAGNSAALAGGGGGSGKPGSTQLALLRLDHMHARAAYSRTLRRWAGELGLGGRLLFCSGGGGCNGRGPAGSGGGGGGGGAAPIILILLEGPASDVKEFVVRLRTRNVDVDSRGRLGGLQGGIWAKAHPPALAAALPAAGISASPPSVQACRPYPARPAGPAASA